MFNLSSREDLLKKSKNDLVDLLYKQNEELKKVEHELKKYKNSNTPSSANKHLKASTQGLREKKGARRGAPKGHQGKTFEWPATNEVIDVPAVCCAHCNSTNIRSTGHFQIKKLICVRPAQTIIKEYHRQECTCLDCHKITLAKHKDMPEKGNYDIQIQSLINYYKFKMRMPLALVAEVMNNVHSVPITPATVLAITKRASDKLAPEYKKLEESIKVQRVVNSDETSCSVQGINHWIWVFCNSLISLFKFQKDRGGDIVEQVLGPGFKGGLVNDGWGTYKSYADQNNVPMQRCWSHLTREVEDECKEKHPQLYNWCCDISGMVEQGKAYLQEKRRIDAHKKCSEEMALLISQLRNHRHLRKLANKIERGAEHWFTCILHPELPKDNNEAERSLRPFVVMRKIMGGLRSESGQRVYEIMMSLVSTWQKQGKNVFSTLQATL